jgi:ATP-grasp in the biosynthetic pathway with Ter operon
MTLVAVRDGNPHRMLTLPVWLEVLREAARLSARVVATPARPAVDLGPTGLAAAELHALPEDATPEELAALLRRLCASAVLSLSDPDPPRLRDARAADLALDRSPQARGSQVAVARALHKGVTREACTRHGVRVAPGVWTSRPWELTALPAAWGERLVVKDVDGWAGRGMAFHDSREAALADLAGRHAPAVVEAFVAGEEVSVEVVAVGSVRVLAGWVLKGPSDLGVHPLFRLRYVPDLPPPPALTSAALAAVDALGLDQLVELEFVGAKGDAWHLLEVNPRASGVTALLRAANGSGTPAMAMRLAAGEDPGLPSRRHCACEFSVPPDSWQALVGLAAGMDDLVHLHATVTNAFWPRCYLAADAPDRLRADVERLAAVCGERLITQLDDRIVRARELVAAGASP